MMCNVQWSRAVQLLAVLTVLGSITVDCTSLVNLRVFRNTKPSGEPGDQVINCSIACKTTALDKIFKLTLLGSSVYGSGDDFDQLAVLDIKSKSPRLVDELQEEDVSVDGSIGSNISSRPYLAVSRRHQPTAAKLQSFKCVVKGQDKSGRLVTLSTTAKPEPVGAKCLEKVELEGINGNISALSRKVGGMLNSTADILSEVQSLHVTLGQFQAKSYVADEQISSKFADLSEELNDLNVKYEDKFGNVSSQILDLTNQVADFETKFREMNEGVSNQLETLAANLKDFRSDMNGQFKKPGIDRSRFEVSDKYRNSEYLVSKTEANFNTAINLCRESGGYLVELDDKEEYQFVKDLVKRIGGSDHFWTGGNDIDREGTFVYYNSKKPVPSNFWTRGMPDDNKGNEDCVEIRLSFGSGINDWVCTRSGKYVCELPLY